MKQLTFNFNRGNKYIPTFETWYAENSHERRIFGDKPYKRKKAIAVYNDLINTGFFDRNYTGGG